MYSETPLQLTVGATSGVIHVHIPFLAPYWSIQNPTEAVLQLMGSSASTASPLAISIQPTKSMVGQWYETDMATVFWTSSAPIKFGGNTAIFAASDHPIQLQVSDNGVVQITGNATVTIEPGQVVDIGNTPAVTIANTPAVTVNSGTVDANITNASIAVTQASGSTLDVTGSTVDVQTPSGSTLNVGGTVTVGNSTLNVVTATGDSVTVAGSVDIGNTPAVTVNSGTVDANITNASLTVGTVQSITETVNSQVQNDYLTSNGFLNGGTTTMSSTTISAGGSVFQFIYVPDGVYDGVLLWINYNSSGGLTGLEFSIAQIRYENGGLGTWANGPSSAFTMLLGDNTNEIAQTDFLSFETPILCNIITLQITNNNTSSITIAPQIVPWVRYASSQIVNPTSAPVYQQPTLGTFNEVYSQQLNGVAVDGGTIGTINILPSGITGYIKQIALIGNVEASTDYYLQLSNQAGTIYTLYSTTYGNNPFNILLPLGDGVYSGELILTTVNNSTSAIATLYLTCYAVITQQGGATVQSAIQ